MSVLMWDKPKRVMSSEEREDRYSADGAPPGTYVPNMSTADKARWKAKLVGKKVGFPQVELRKDGMVIVLSLKGYKYKHYDLRQTKGARRWPTVHIALSGPMQLTLEELDELKLAIDEGMQFLRDLEKCG